MKNLFGTDGIRGIANVTPLTIDTCVKVAKAINLKFLSDENTKSPTVIIGKDTRISGDIFEYALAAGFCSLGVNVKLLGVIPTPAVSVLVKKWHADFGIVISASHNPYYDNGIKLFNSQGIKLTDEEEVELEQLMQLTIIREPMTHEKVGRVQHCKEAFEEYSADILASFNFDTSLTGNYKIAIDCANGALSNVAPEAFRKLGFNVISKFASPSGININDKCGVTHPETLIKLVTDENADFGIAFDGDGDRVLLCDSNGRLLNGDDILGILSLNQKNDEIVSTIMSNFAFEKYLNKQNIKLIRTNVGDRYISEYMQTHNAEIGGEPSGHIIIKSHSLTGDGLFAGLKVLEILLMKKELFDNPHLFTPLPIVNKNVNVTDKAIIENNKVIDCINQCRAQLNDRGRLIVRPSGTEPLIRISVEGENINELKSIADEIEKAIGLC